MKCVTVIMVCPVYCVIATDIANPIGATSASISQPYVGPQLVAEYSDAERVEKCSLGGSSMVITVPIGFRMAVFV